MRHSGLFFPAETTSGAAFSDRETRPMALFPSNRQEILK
jgi:hypothetical protein